MIETDVPIEKFEETCRVCLIQCETLVSIHEIVFTHAHSHNAGQTQDVLLSEVFQKYCNVWVYEDDLKPQKICEMCVKLIAKAFNIFEAFCESNELLDKILQKHGSNFRPHEVSVKVEESSFLPYNVTEEDVRNDHNDDSNKENSKASPKVHLEQLADETNKNEFCYRVIIDSDIEEDFSTDSQGGESITNIVDSETEHFQECNQIKQENSGDVNEPASKKLCLETPSAAVKLPNTGKGKWDHTYYVKENHSLGKVLPGGTEKPNISIAKPGGSSSFISDCSNKRPTAQANENDIFNCRLCEGLPLQGMGEVIEHIKAIHPSDEECILCPKWYTKFKVLLSHVASHANKQDLLCDKCHIYFVDKESLEAHYETDDHKKNAIIRCNICNKDFKQEFFLKRHVKEVHMDTEQGVCPKCGLFIKFRSLERHLLKHAEKTNHLCEYCLKGFVTARALKKHIIIEHDGKFTSKPDPDKGKGKEGKKQNEKKKIDRTFACEYCPETFGTRSTFFAHRISHPECRGVPCPFCDQVLEDPVAYRNHRAAVHSDHICDVCQKGWPSKPYLDQHKYNTHRARVYKCSVCPKSFKFSQSLKTHETTHTDEKPFACHYCDRRFRQRTHVVQHETCMHMKSKKHQCSICEKSFTYISGLKAHLRTHIGLRPFNCPYCDKSYTDTIGRHKHVKANHPDKMEDFIIFKQQNQSSEARLADFMPQISETMKSEWLKKRRTASAAVENVKAEYSEDEYDEDCLIDGLNPSGETQEVYTFMDVMDENSSIPSSDNSMKE